MVLAAPGKTLTLPAPRPTPRVTPRKGEGSGKREADRAARRAKLQAAAWRLANRFGWLMGVEPHLVFAPTRGQARVETVRHLVAHVLLEIDRCMPTDLDVVMERDRSSLRNSFKRAWDLRDNPAIEDLILFVSETRWAKGAKFRAAARGAKAAFDAHLKPSGGAARYTPKDFDAPLMAAARALRGLPPEAGALPPRAAPKPEPQRIAEDALPPPARILRDSPLTRRLMRDVRVEAQATANGGARVEVIGRAAKDDMSGISEKLARVLEAAGFTAAREGVFATPKSSAWRAVLRVAPAALAAALALWGADDGLERAPARAEWRMAA